MRLKGKTILVTRPAGRAEGTIREFEGQGYNVVHIPLIEIAEPSDGYAALDSAIERLNGYDWLIFTSANAVSRFFSRPGAPSGDEVSARVAAAGPVTAAALEGRGVVGVVVADEPHAEGLLATLAAYDFKGRRVLFPRAREGREVLADGLRDRGATVDVVEIYRTIVPPDLDCERLKAIISEGQVDAVHFASPSAVRNFLGVIDAAGLRNALDSLEFISIGPTTAKTLKSCGC